MKFQTITLPVNALEICERVRVRQNKPRDGSDVVLDYAEAYGNNLITEPLDVFQEKGTERYVIADGEHRLLALNKAKIKEVECRVYEGDEIDAGEFATHCNQKHGLRRTKADIYKAFRFLIETPRLAEKYRTDTQLSEQLGISIRTVKSYRADWRESDGGDKRTQKKKQAAAAKAAKHDPVKHKSQTAKTEETPKANMQASCSQDAENTTKNEKPTRIEAKKDTAKSTSENSLSASAVMNLRQAIALLQDIPAEAHLQGALGSSVKWGQVEHAHAVLGNLLSAR